MHQVPVLLVVVLMVGAPVAALAGQWRAGAARGVAIATTATTLVLAVVGLVSSVVDGPIRADLGGWPPPIGIEYLLDPLAGFMATIVASIGLLVVVYPPKAGFGEVPGRGVPIYTLTLLLLCGLMGVVLTADLFHLFVALEIFAIASYALVSLGGSRATFASFRYLLFGTLGSGFYLLGVGFVYFMTGTLNMADVADRLPPIAGSETVLAALALIVVGLAVKMALFPLHVWLPEAHSYAPPAVAALLAAVQVKVPAYALIRILFGVFDVQSVSFDVPITDLLVWFGAAGIVFGSIMAIAQTDLKRLLAYSTIAQLGYIGVGIGLANPLALVGALLHVLNHAVMKSCLFLIAGGIYEQTKIRRISSLAGLSRRMPLTAAAFVVAALSMVGVPPTAGFFSKWYLLLGALDEGAVVVAAVIGLSSLLTLWYFLRLFEVIYAKNVPLDPALEAAKEPTVGVLGPVWVLAGAIVVIGLANAVIVGEVLDLVSLEMLGSRP